MLETAPYGAWTSPITPERLTQGAVSIGLIAADGGALYWTEMRPWEGGRTTLMRRGGDGEAREVTPAPFNVRSRVHEYGGAPFCAADGRFWFVDGNDGRIYTGSPDDAPRAVTRGVGASDRRSFADLVHDPAHQRIIAVCEREVPGSEPENTLVAIEADGTVTPVAQGADFYAFPRLSPEGDALVWIEWDHPNMPWDGTRLMIAPVQADGSLGPSVQIAGGPDESVFQPAFAPDGELYFVSDASGHWNLYRAGDGHRHYAAEAEFGLPLWQFGMSTYAFLGPDAVLAAHARDGDWSLVHIDLKTGAMTPRPGPWVTFNWLTGDGQGRVWFSGGYADRPEALIELNAADEGDVSGTVVKRTADIDDVPREGISVAEEISFESGGRLTHAYFYPPANAGFAAPEGALPPLIVKGHGGPTGQTTRDLSLKIQYWTSRGFAVVDVNYGGSAGYGRAYRRRLNREWGIVDVEDCVNAALHLAETGRVDREAMAITGGSAGGFTTLCALTFHDVFKAGCSAYGIGDLVALTRDTHKFESHYPDCLIGRWPEEAEVYRARSPINHTERLSCPVIFLQGADDKVVPPNQAEEMVDALRAKKLPVAYILFEGEGHGFRKAENIKRALEAELSFYGQVFGFEPAGPIEPVKIENRP